MTRHTTCRSPRDTCHTLDTHATHVERHTHATHDTQDTRLAQHTPRNADNGGQETAATNLDNLLHPLAPQHVFDGEGRVLAL